MQQLPFLPVVSTEKVVLVDMGPDLGPAYQALEQTTIQRLEKLQLTDFSDYVRWLRGLLAYLAMPWLDRTIGTRQAEVLGQANALPGSSLYPLERAVLDYIDAQSAPTVIFTEYTGRENEQERLKALCEDYLSRGERSRKAVAILRGDIPPSKRQAWINERAEEGIGVLICNPRLVGHLNLAYFKRVAYKSLPLQRLVFVRSARCLLHPGQTGYVETVFFAYAASVSQALLVKWCALLRTPSMQSISWAPTSFTRLNTLVEEIVQAVYETEKAESYNAHSFSEEQVAETDQVELPDPPTGRLGDVSTPPAES